MCPNFGSIGQNCPVLRSKLECANHYKFRNQNLCHSFDYIAKYNHKLIEYHIDNDFIFIAFLNIYFNIFFKYFFYTYFYIF